MRHCERVMTALVVVLATAGLLLAQSGEKAGGTSSAPARGSAAKKEAKARATIAVTPEREAAVLTFVQRNHAELVDLLASLKASQPQEYERAVRDIFRTTERLALVQERDPLQYELEIAAWTAQSRVQLLAARLKMETSDELLRQLRDALGVQGDARLALLTHERQKAADRLAKWDRDISQYKSSRQETIDRQFDLLTRTAGEGRGAKSTAKQTKKKAP